MAATKKNAVTARPGRPDEDYAEWIASQMKAAQRDSIDWRQNARENYDFVAGRQWSDDDIAILEEQRRPPITFNRIARTINAVAGLEIQNRMCVKYAPRKIPQDSGESELLTDAADWARDLCNAEDEESEAFRDLAICAMGWTEHRLDYDEDADGLVKIERTDPLEMFWDSKATKKNLADTKWRARVRKMSREDAKDLFPNWTGGSKGTLYLDDSATPHDASPPFYNGKDLGKNTTDDVEVVHFEHWEKEDFYRVLDPAGNIVRFDAKKFAKMKDYLDAAGVKYVKQKAKRFYTAFMIGDEIVEARAQEIQSDFTFQVMTGMRDRNKNSWVALVDLQKDPQRWANKWLSQTLHIINTNAKGGLMAETGAFVNPRKAEDSWARSDAITWMNPGGMEKVREKPQSQLPAGIYQLMQYAIEAVSDTPGVNQELMGVVGHEQPGILESMRKNAGVTILAFLFDALRLYRKSAGRILAEYIREYIADGRLVRISGPDGAKYIPLIRDALSFEFDVIVDDAPSSYNQKEKVVAVLSNIIPAMSAAGAPPPPPEVIEYLPLPQELVDKWMQATKPNPQKQQADAQFAEALKHTELKERNAKAELDMARANAEVIRAQSELAKVQAPAEDKAQLAAIELQWERERAAIAQATEIEKAKIAANTQVFIEQMKLAAQPQETPEMPDVVGPISQQLSDVMRAIEGVAQQKRKTINVVRGPDGSIQGADVVEEVH